MATVSVAQRSRLRFGQLLTVDGFDFWDLLLPPTIVVQPDDSFYTAQDGDRLDTIAFKFYQDSVLWWVVAVANNLELIDTELNVGTILRIPSPRYVREVLFRKARV